MSMLYLKGFIPQKPTILCKDEDTAILIQTELHNHLTHEPAVIVEGNWPEDSHISAVVVTPLVVLGQSEKSDFRVKAALELKDSTKNVLNAMTRLAMSGTMPNVRNLSTATGQSKRQIGYAIKQLAEAGLIARDDERHIRILFGRWRPDRAAARAAGIEIEDL